MLKALRKYNKWLMATFGVLLMVAFLAPQMVQSLVGDPAKRTIGTLDGRRVILKEFEVYNREYEGLKHLVQLLGSNGLLNQDPILRNGLPFKNVEHYFLFATEAERAGFVAASGDGRNFYTSLTGNLWVQIGSEDARAKSARGDKAAMQKFIDAYTGKDEILRAQYESQADQFRENIRRQSAGLAHLNELEFDRALARLDGIIRLIFNYFTALRTSDGRAIVAAKAQTDSVFADVLVIPADRLAHNVAEPSADELKAHFERFKDLKPGEGEFGLGYRQPARVKLEWLKLDIKAISDAIPVDPIEVRARWDKAKPKGTAEEFKVDAPRFEQEMKQDRVEEVLAEAETAMRGLTNAIVASLPANGSVRTLPADWEKNRPTMEKLAAQLQAETQTAFLSKHPESTSFKMPLPTVEVRSSEWLALDDLSRLDGIGAATVTLGTSQYKFPATVLSVHELAGGQTKLPLQVGIPAVFQRSFIDPAGNHYYFTVTAARPEEALTSPDEIKDKVLAGYRKLKAYDLLKAQAEQTKASALSGGLDALARSFPLVAKSADAPKDDTLPIRKNLRFGTEPAAQGDELQTSKELHAAINALTATLDPLVLTSNLPLEKRLTVVPLPKAQSLAVIRIERVVPLTMEKLRETVEQSARMLDFNLLPTLGSPEDPFSYENLKKRMNYTSAAREEGEDAGPKAGSSPAKPKR